MEQHLERPPGRLNASALLHDLELLLPAGSEEGGLHRVLARVSEAGQACAGGSCRRLPARHLPPDPATNSSAASPPPARRAT